MKALTLQEYGRLVYGDVPDPRVEENDVLISVKACGICGSDVHGLDGSTGRRIPPLIMGHEAAGIIAETGSRAGEWRIGERVTFDSTLWCGECWRCRRGEINLCERRRVLGVSTAEYRQNGAFAQYVAVPKHILHRIPADMLFFQAAMTEPLSVAFHAVRLARPATAESAVVVGAGMIGLLLIQVLRASGCGAIISMDIDERKLERSRRMGADVGCDPASPGCIREVMELTKGRGADMAFEAVGVSAAVASAVGSVRAGGRVVLVGNVSPRVEIPLQAVVSRQIVVLGSCASQGEYPECLELIARRRVDVNSFVSARVPLSDGADWFDRLYRQEPDLMKVILEP